MSWFGGYKPSSSKPTVSEEDLKKAKREKLEADRLARAKQRAQHKKQLEAVIKARQEADEALQDLLNIDPELFADADDDNNEQISPEEEELLLQDSIEVVKMVNFGGFLIPPS